MKTYQNLNHNSGIVRFEILENAIIIEFKQGKHRKYTYQVPQITREQLNKMKDLALGGRGLNSYITRYIKENYTTRS